MPAVETMDRWQKAVLWPAVLDQAGRVLFSRHGEPLVSTTPVEVYTRWENCLKQILLPNGNVVQITATVVVNRDVDIGSRMWLGGLDDLPGTAFLPETGVNYVYGFDSTPDIKNRFQRKTLLLTRDKDSLPSST